MQDYQPTVRTEAMSEQVRPREGQQRKIGADAVGMAEHAQRTARLRDLQPELIAEREGAE